MNRFEVLWRGIHDSVTVRRVGAVADRPVNHADSISLGNIYRLLEISFRWDVRVRIKARIGHGIENLEEGERVLHFYHRQCHFEADLCQQCLDVNEVEFSPPFLIEVTAKDGHEVCEKAMDDVPRDIACSDSVLFRKG